MCDIRSTTLQKLFLDILFNIALIMNYVNRERIHPRNPHHSRNHRLRAQAEEVADLTHLWEVRMEATKSQKIHYQGRQINWNPLMVRIEAMMILLTQKEMMKEGLHVAVRTYICARFCPTTWFPFCMVRYRKKTNKKRLNF